MLERQGRQLAQHRPRRGGDAEDEVGDRPGDQGDPDRRRERRPQPPPRGERGGAEDGDRDQRAEQRQAGDPLDRRAGEAAEDEVADHGAEDRAADRRDAQLRPRRRPQRGAAVDRRQQRVLDLGRLDRQRPAAGAAAQRGEDEEGDGDADDRRGVDADRVERGGVGRRFVDRPGEDAEPDRGGDRADIDAVEHLHHVDRLDVVAAARAPEVGQRPLCPGAHRPIIGGVSPATPYGPRADPGPPGLTAKLLGFCEELRSEGVAVGTSEILDAFAALEQVPWTDPDDFREALAATIAKSQDDRRAFELIFDRYFFRAAEAEAVARGITEEDGFDAPNQGATPAGEGDGARLDIDELREQIREAMADGDEGKLRDLARLAIAAFGRAEGSGVVGVDVQRIRRTLGLTTGPQQGTDGAAGAAADRPRAAEPVRAPPAARARTRPDRAHPDPSPRAASGRARPRSADQPDPGSGGGPSRRLADEAAAGDARPGAARPLEEPGGRRAADDALLARDRRRPAPAPLQAEAAAAARDLRPLRRLHLGHLGHVFFLSVLHALHDSFRKLRSFVFIERISEVTDVFEHERDFAVVARKISSEGGVADVSGYTDYGRVWLEFLTEISDELDPRSTVIVLGDARTNGREPHAEVFAQVAERAGRLFWLNPEPKLYWNYGDSVMAAYERYCDGAFECWTTRHLENFVNVVAGGVPAAE